MFHELNPRRQAGLWFGLLLAVAAVWCVNAQDDLTNSLPDASAVVTNLFQLTQLLNLQERVVRDVRLEATVCSASDPAIGVLIFQDSTDAELFEFSGGIPKFLPG